MEFSRSYRGESKTVNNGKEGNNLLGRFRGEEIEPDDPLCRLALQKFQL